MKVPQILLNLDTEQFIKLVSQIVNEQIYLNHYSYVDLCENESYQQILDTKQYFQNIFVAIVNQNINEPDLKEFIQNIEIDSQKLNIIFKLIQDNLFLIKKKTVQSLLVQNHYYLIDFNWNINVTVSHSNIQILQVPMLLLELHLKNNQNQFKKIVLEMKKNELLDFIQKISSIKKSFI